MKVSHPPRPRFTSRVSTAHPGMTHTTTKYTLFGNRPNIQRSASPSRQRPRACFPKRNPEKKKKHNKLMVTTLTVLTIHGGERWVYKAVGADWELMG